jgi:hypothetical protein
MERKKEGRLSNSMTGLRDGYLASAGVFSDCSVSTCGMVCLGSIINQDVQSGYRNEEV